jgi:excisionase family DNA binding protein
MTYLTASEVAQQIRKTEDYVQRQCKAGVIKAKKLGNEWRISDAALATFMGDETPAPATRTRLTARQQRHAS